MEAKKVGFSIKNLCMYVVYEVQFFFFVNLKMRD